MRVHESEQDPSNEMGMRYEMQSDGDVAGGAGGARNAGWRASSYNRASEELAPSTYYFAGQSAAVQARNTAGFKSSGGKIVLAGFVDTSGYSTAIKEKYQGFLITETKLSFDGGTLEPGSTDLVSKMASSSL